MNIESGMKENPGLILTKDFYFFFPFLGILITMYRNSIIPGHKILMGNDIFIISGISVVYLLIIYDFNALFNINLTLFKATAKFIALLFFLFFVSTVFFNFQEISVFSYFMRLVLMLLNLIVFFWLIPKFILIEPAYFKKLVLTISYFSIFASVIGFVMLALNIDAGKPGQMVSFIGHPNDVAVIFNSGVISTVFYLDWQKNSFTTYKKYLFYFFILMQMLASLLTYTRAGYIGLGCALMLYFFLKYRTKFLYSIPFFIALIVIVIPPFFKAKGFGSFISRLYLLIPAYNMMTRDTVSLLWGYGTTGAFKEFLRYNMFNLANEEHLNNPHNVIASLILMYGLIFTVVICVLVGYFLLKGLVRSLRSKAKNKSLLYAYIVSILVSYILLSFFDSSILMPEFFNMQIFLIFLGLLNYLFKPDFKETVLVQ